MVKKRGNIFVISAPSGAGKTTLCRALLGKYPRLVYSVSVTTRRPRPGEKNGRDYYFVNRKEFNQMVRDGELIEWAQVHDHYYGTPRKFLEKCLARGRSVILDIDVQGGINIKKHFPESVLIFIMAPSWKILRQRLSLRGDTDENTVRKRLRNARREVRFKRFYDYVVINDTVDRAVNNIYRIIRRSERRSNEGLGRFTQTDS